MLVKITQGLNGTYSGSKYYVVCIRLFLCLIAGSCTLYAGAQQENPFELKNRTPPKKVLKDSTMIKDSLVSTIDTLLLDSMNSSLPSIDIFSPPVADSLFDEIITSPDTAIVPNALDTLVTTGEVPDTFSTELENKPPSDEVTSEEPQGSEKDPVGIVHRLDELPLSDQFDIKNKNVLLGVSILALLFLASLLAVNRSLIRKAYRAVANDNYLRFLNREYKSMPWLYWLFYFHFFINAGFFTYLFLHYFKWYQGGSLIVMLFCILFVFGTYILKHLTLGIIAAAFPVEKETSLYGFVTLLVNILLGIVLLPINLLIAFGPSGVVPFVIWTGVSLVVLFYLFRQLKGLFISGRLVRSYLFHFFLYLCSAEIAPLLIVGKLALGNFGVN